MRRPLCALLLSLCATGSLVAGPTAAAGRSWLMMVTTQNTDPAQEAAFNDWYDRIDIPDVLEVPGYKRARRGLEQRVAQDASSESPLNYVALYDIDSSDIDKTIIKMLMASWGMEKTHHSTPLLKVTERVYFEEDRAPLDAPDGAGAGDHRYLYLAKFAAGSAPAERREFGRWYDRQYVPAVLAARGVTRITRYRRYWVLMDKPAAVPEFMSVVEIDAVSAGAAVESLRVIKTPEQSGHVLFLKISDVRRP